MKTVFVHGAPNGPDIWEPLIAALDLSADDCVSLALPGFSVPCPEGFIPSSEAYVDWLIVRLEQQVSLTGEPVRVVGHDFGAAFTLRACSLCPELVSSWVVFSSLIDSELKRHLLAKLFHAPVIGELLSSIATNKWLVLKGLQKQGVPHEVAMKEASSISNEMYRCVLALYRTPREKGQPHPWEEKLSELPKDGLLVWGADDPYVPVSIAKRFSARWGYPLHIEPDTGHWVFVQRPTAIAKRLYQFWNG